MIPGTSMHSVCICIFINSWIFKIWKGSDIESRMYCWKECNVISHLHSIILSLHSKVYIVESTGYYFTSLLWSVHLQLFICKSASFYLHTLYFTYYTICRSTLFVCCTTRGTNVHEDWNVDCNWHFPIAL